MNERGFNKPQTGRPKEPTPEEVEALHAQIAIILRRLVADIKEPSPQEIYPFVDRDRDLTIRPAPERWFARSKEGRPIQANAQAILSFNRGDVVEIFTLWSNGSISYQAEAKEADIGQPARELQSAPMHRKEELLSILEGCLKK